MAIYMSMLNMQVLKKRGGIDAVEKYNREKAAMLYDEIDRNPFSEEPAKGRPFRT